MRSPSILLENHLFSASIGQQTEPSESLIIAETTTTASNTSSEQQTIAFPFFLTIPLTVLVTLVLVTLWLQKEKLSQFFQSILPKDSSQEFAVDIEVLNVRTKDYLRANVQATIYVYIAYNDKQKAQNFLVEGRTISAVVVEKAVKKRAETAIRVWASQYKLEELHQNLTKVEVDAKKTLDDGLKKLNELSQKLTKVEVDAKKTLDDSLKKLDELRPNLTKVEGDAKNTLHDGLKNLDELRENLTKAERDAKNTLDDGLKKLNELCQKLTNLVTNLEGDAKNILNNGLKDLGLTVRQLVIGEIEESVNYNQDNYFDAKAIQARTAVIQAAIYGTRKKELLTEQNIREEELEIGKNIRIHELKIGIELENKEVEHQQTSFENLEKLKSVEKGKIDHELFIEKYQNEKEKELQEAIKTSELALRKKIEITELDSKKELEKKINETDIEIQLHKILEDTKLIEKNKTFQLEQVKAHQAIETGEIAETILIIGKEKERLEKEKERTQAEEAVTDAIEIAKALRHYQQAQISAENEAKTIERLAEAEGKRYSEISADKKAQMVLIQELAPLLTTNLPQIVEIAKALAPQAGVLGDSNIYFSNGSGEDIHKLVLSTSSLFLIQSLLDGKLGHLLFELLRSLKNDGKSE